MRKNKMPRGTKRRQTIADNDKDSVNDDEESPSAKASPPPRRSPRRKPSRVSYKEEEDYDDDEEMDEGEIAGSDEREEEKTNSAEDFDAEQLNEEDDDEASERKKRKKPRRKRSLTLRRRRKKPTKDDLTCPHCRKLFTVLQGLEYHVDNFVCRQELRPGGPIRKGRRKVSEGSDAPKSRYKRLRGSLKDRTCPKCKRVFTSTLGLNYHMEKRVCQEKANKSKKLKIKPFDTLNAGDQFVTSYGIVEVVQDSCAVPTADIPSNLPTARKQWLGIKANRDAQAQKQNAFATAVHRAKRARLADLYQKDQIDQQTVFRAYLGKDPRKIPPEDYPPVFVAAPLGPDPSAPHDSYPDRMVECKLIPDERGRFVGVDEAEPASQSQAAIASALEGTRLFLRRRVLKEIYHKDQKIYICKDCGQCFSSKPGCKYHMQSNVCLQRSKTAKEESTERLRSIESHSTRLLQQMATSSKKRAFKRKRDKSVANVSVYPQVWLSLAFKLLPRSSNTTRAGTISAFKEESEEEDAEEDAGAAVPRAKRYKRSDSDASLALEASAEHTSGPTLDSTALKETIGLGEEDKPDAIVGSGTVQKDVSMAKRGHLKKEKKPKKEDDEDFENPALVLEQLQRELIFERSRFLGPMYSSVFKALKFQKPKLKKPSSQRKRRRKMAKKVAAAEARRKQEEADAKRKAAEAEARRKQEEAEARRKQEEEEVKKKAAEAEARRIQHEIEVAEAARRRQEIEAEKKSKKATRLTLPSKPLLPIIDTRALVNEVEAGRYPSLKRYKGDHADKCYICKKGGELVCCDFCSKAVHFSCMLQRFIVREPEPGDDFMCNHCIQTIQARRNRAEKRRIKKHGEQIRKSQEAAALKTRLAGELVDTMEYECLAEQGQRASEITELLQDTQKRLEQCLNTAKLNNLRRSTIESSEEW